MAGRVVRLVISGFKANRLIVMNNDQETQIRGLSFIFAQKEPEDGQAKEFGHV